MTILDVIVPVHVDTEQKYKYFDRMLNSIVCQELEYYSEVVNFCFVLDNNSSQMNNKIKELIEKRMLSRIDKFNYKVHQVFFKDAGLSRQFGIDKTESEYITFMDADDQYYNNKAIQDCLEAIEECRGCDYIATTIAKGYQEGGKITTEDKTFSMKGNLYGYIIDRCYINQNDIKFVGDMKLYEDTYYTDIVKILAETNTTINKPTYIWMQNEESMTHSISNDQLILEDIDGYLKYSSNILNYFETTRPDKLLVQIQIFIVLSYFKLIEWKRTGVAEDKLFEICLELRNIMKLYNYVQLSYRAMKAQVKTKLKEDNSLTKGEINTGIKEFKQFYKEITQ